jgi:prolyl-tRNA synthetase
MGTTPCSAPAAAAPKAAAKAPADASTLAAREAAALAARRDLEGKAGVQLGLTVKKEQAVFGEWYSQASS